MNKCLLAAALIAASVSGSAYAQEHENQDLGLGVPVLPACAFCSYQPIPVFSLPVIMGKKETQPEEPIVAWARSSADLCQRQAHPENWDSFDKAHYKKQRAPEGVCLLDHQRAASACSLAAINRDDAYANNREPSRTLKVGCRWALQSIQAKYGEYNEDIPEDVGKLAYRTHAERKLDMILTTKAGMLEFPERQFKWCTKLFGKEQRQCERFYQSYVRTFGTIKYERIVRQHITHIIALCRKHLGKACGM